MAKCQGEEMTEFVSKQFAWVCNYVSVYDRYTFKLYSIEYTVLNWLKSS